MKIYEDLRTVQLRLSALQYVMVGLMGLLVAVFWYLQVLRGRYYRDLAENNRVRAVPIAAPRGALLDRHGRILVENRPSFNVVLTPEHSEDLDAAVARLARVLGVGEAQLRERLAARRHAPLRSVVVKGDATPEDVAAVEARRAELQETSVEVVPLRSYPLGPVAAHTFGRVGEVTERQLESEDFQDLQPGNLVGQAGIESQYNRSLMGRDGLRRVIVNSRGLEVAEADRMPPVAGPSMRLSIDRDLQSAMDEAFAGRAGSAIALDPRTGEVLAITSTPAYDPNQFATGIEHAVWARLTTDPETPLMNRVIQGQYAPGSTFKIVVAVAALEEGVISPGTTFYCPGYLAIYGTMFRCHKPAGHGMMDVHKALAQSCNVFFYNVGVRLEIERISRYAKRLGLGEPTGIDLPHEAPGLVPSPEWKLRTQKVPWYAGETVSVAIGQGQVSVTPIQMARLAAAVATGRIVRPHLVLEAGGETLSWPAPREIGLKPSTLALVRSGLSAVVNEHGTGWRARLNSVEVAGKTGSAQVVAKSRLARNPSDPSYQPHGWFVGFAPAQDPRIAFAVLVEHGRSGGESAAPVARDVLARFFDAALPGATVAMVGAGGAADTDRP